MSDIERAEDLPPSPAPAGERLCSARVAQGLSLAAIAERTRVPLRHLEAIEAGDYASLPSPTYATGFARAYARAVGIDEVEVAREVRAEAAKLGRRQPEYEPYVTADPARLPSRGLVIVTAGIALAVIVLAALWLGTGWLRGRPSANAEAPVQGGAGAAVASQPAASTAPSLTSPVSPTLPIAHHQVRLTANDTIWLRVYDAANKTLFLGTMKSGDKFDVPPDADHPKINIGRADKLAVTLDGKPVAALGTGERPIKDVAVDAASLAARVPGSAPVVTPFATALPSPSASPSPSSSPSPRASPSTRVGDHSRKSRTTGGGDETQRANRRSERAAERGEAPPVPSGTLSPAVPPAPPSGTTRQ